MEDLSKRLVEVESVLKRLEGQYLEKIPNEIWEYISNNKSTDYKYEYDESKVLEEQNLHIDTIAILTYINMEYLADENQKVKIQEILREESLKFYDEKYNPDNLFKKKANNVTAPVQCKKENFIKKLLKKIKCFWS